MRGEPIFDDVARLDTEYHVAVQMWFARNEIPDDVVAHHLFVHRIGFDVFAVETDARFGRAHALECIDETPRAR